jgi:hypothetical protein
MGDDVKKRFKGQNITDVFGHFQYLCKEYLEGGKN